MIKKKAKLLYDFLDQSQMFKGTAEPDSRSLMNVPFVTGDTDMDPKFVAEAKGVSYERALRQVQEVMELTQIAAREGRLSSFLKGELHMSTGLMNKLKWGDGIRVNGIAPGFFVTNQNRGLLFTDDGKPTARTEKILAATPQKRFGEVADLIGTLLWLASDEASGFVTGVIIPVDGGFNAYSGV